MKDGVMQLVEALCHKPKERVRSPKVSLECFIDLTVILLRWRIW